MRAGDASPQVRAQSTLAPCLDPGQDLGCAKLGGVERRRWGEQGCSGWKGGVATTALSCFAPRTRPGFIFGPVFARGLCGPARAWVVVVVGGGCQEIDT